MKRSIHKLKLTGTLVAILIYGAGPALSAVPVVLSEIFFDPVGVDTGRQVVEILNPGPGSAEIGGFWLAFMPAAWQFPDTVTVPAGATILVHVNRSGVNTATEFYTGTAGLRNLRRDDSLSLFTENVFSDPSRLVDFVAWGSAGQAGEEVAVNAGKWSSGLSVSVLTLREGSSISRHSQGNFSAGWCIDGTPSLGAPHDDCADSRARSPVRINELRPGPGGLVELKNAGQVLEDLGAKWLLSKTSSFRFTPGTLLLPGSLLLVHLGATGTDRDGEIYTGPFLDLQTSDSLVFATSSSPDSTQVIDFLEWGSAGMPFEAQAATANLWVAGDPIPVSELVSGGSVAASEDQGVGSARWFVDNTPTFLAENSSSPERKIVINEVLVSPPAGASPAVEIWNGTDAAVDLSGFRLCSSEGEPPVPICASLPNGTMLLPGGFLVLRFGPGALAAGELQLPTLPALDPSGGELSLLVNAPHTSTNNYLDYLRWGNGGAVMEDIAAAAGIWAKGDAIDSSLVVPNSSFAYEGEGQGPASYRIDVSPSLGRRNAEPPTEKAFSRGDCNQDGSLDLSDPINIVDVLFLGEARPLCEDSCDLNDDGGLDISDPIYELQALFQGGSPPRPPIFCNPDPTSDGLSCEFFAGCQ